MEKRLLKSYFWYSATARSLSEQVSVNRRESQSGESPGGLRAPLYLFAELPWCAASRTARVACLVLGAARKRCPGPALRPAPALLSVWRLALPGAASWQRLRQSRSCRASQCCLAVLGCRGALRRLHCSFHQFIVSWVNASSYRVFIRRHQKLEPSLPFSLIVTSKFSSLGFFYSPADWKRPVWDLGSYKSYGLTSGRADQEEYLFSRTKNYQAAGSQHGSATVLCWTVLVSTILIYSEMDLSCGRGEEGRWSFAFLLVLFGQVTTEEKPDSDFHIESAIWGLAMARCNDA